MFFFHKEPVLVRVEVPPAGNRLHQSLAVPEATGRKVGWAVSWGSRAWQPAAGGGGQRRGGPDGLGSAGLGKALRRSRPCRPSRGPCRPQALAFLGRTSWAAAGGWLMITRKHAGTPAPSGSEGPRLAEAASAFRACDVTALW